ncbi:MAG: hypothetical protein KC589_00745 [Nanoarchaeota archaeon]|nr:hypothetical protein [Nanoarchaeota archaeon]
MIEELIQYGFSEKEANIYLVCLKIGQGTANRIAELSNNPRSTTYDILEKFKSLGLISLCIIDNKTQYIVSDPQALLTYINEKKQNIERILPQLEKIQNKIEEKPKAQVYQGKLAIIKLLDEILENASELKVMGSQGNALEKIAYHPEKFMVKRLDKKIKIKQILEDSPESRKIKKDKLTLIKFSKKLNDSKEAIFIFDKFVYHIILQYEISAIKIESIDHAKAMEIMFDEFWESIK